VTGEAGTVPAHRLGRHANKEYWPAPLSARDHIVVCRQFDDLATRLVGEGAEFTHRDYDARNLMVRDDGTLAVIDFQDATIGPSHYDLVSLLRDSYFECAPRFEPPSGVVGTAGGTFPFPS